MKSNSATSYQHKLLQLQLLHNSNNVDYIRRSGDETSENQIYAPDSVYTNHYGYSSMRSNLKSAASEFSFIRPSSSGHNQSTLPHQPHHQQRNSINQFVISDQSTQSKKQSTSRNPFNLNDSAQPSSLSCKKNQQNGINSNINEFNQRHLSSSLSKQYLINSFTGDNLTNNKQPSTAQDPHLSGLTSLNILMPMSGLPLKQNKKRAALVNSSLITAPAGCAKKPLKSTSITSSIACFFRRAFSCRSKKSSRKRKLAESCSSSLGAFEEAGCVVPVVPSAFSTGFLSVDGKKNLSLQQQNNSLQSQRMIDMIEAFAQKTQLAAEVADETHNIEVCKAQSKRPVVDRSLTPAATNSTPCKKELMTPTQLGARRGQFGSPLHKSNSISATIGLSAVEANNIRRGLLYDRELLANSNNAGGGSPMLMRSTKVMSANLTPLMSRRQYQDQTSVDVTAQQFFMSPRNSMKPDHLPRPSSIYGQPSMISSPINARKGTGRHNFGEHRNSFHSQQFKDIQLKNPSLLMSADSAQLRRQQLMKLPFSLDTTREVAEEISSPTDTENQFGLNYSNQPSSLEGSSFVGLGREGADRDIVKASPSGGHLTNHYQHQRAIVNPIFQSPTMDAIYDNHFDRPCEITDEPVQSHYDNHNHLLNEQQQQQQYPRSPMMRLSSPRTNSELPTSPCLQQDLYTRTPRLSQSSTPMRISKRGGEVIDLNSEKMILDMKLNLYGKPSAVVIPSTASSKDTNNNNSSEDFSNPINLRHNIINNPTHHQAISSPLMGSGSSNSSNKSPLLTRRALNYSSHYQQSPLVSQKIRILNKGDGVQATVIGDQLEENAGEGKFSLQPVVNIAGAPGINLEPSLAASLLKGTNINAYECSTYDHLDSNSNYSSTKTNSKTFLVSTRLSKSLAQEQNLTPTSNANSPSPRNVSAFKDNIDSVTMDCNLVNKDDEPSSSISRSYNSSSERGFTPAKDSPSLRFRSGQGDLLRESSFNDANGSIRDQSNDRSSSNSSASRRSKHKEKSSNRLSRRLRGRESSTEVSETDTANTSQTDSLEKLEKDRNWITSKLVE